jgi:hypothetical protein
MMSAIVKLGAPWLALTLLAGASPQDRFPVAPQVRPDPDEIALAMTAAPAEISSRAAIYTVRDGRAIQIRNGTNECACMVGRDLHEGSLYPICFDAEGARTRLWRELLELQLRIAGHPEAEVRRRVEAAYAAGTLKRPSAMSVTYMMSPQQVLFSSPQADGRRVGAWWPHLMIMGPGLTAKGLGLLETSAVTMFSVGPVAEGHDHELVVKLPSWSDGTPVKR